MRLPSSHQLLEALRSLTGGPASRTQLQALVDKGVVDVALGALLGGAPQPAAQLRARVCTTLQNCLSVRDIQVPEAELGEGRVAALEAALQDLARAVPEPARLLNARISLPAPLPQMVSWVWYLPVHVLDRLSGVLVPLVSRLVCLVWPEGCPGVGSPAAPAHGGSGALTGPLPVAANTLAPRQVFLQALGGLLALFNPGPDTRTPDPRLLQLLRGSSLPPPPSALIRGAPPGAGLIAAADAPAAGTQRPVLDPGDEGAAAAGGNGGPPAPGGAAGRQCCNQQAALPARLVRLLERGPELLCSVQHSKVVEAALNLLADIAVCAVSGGCRELLDDALDAGLLDALAALELMPLGQHGGKDNRNKMLQAYWRLLSLLVACAELIPGLEDRICESGVPAQLAGMAFAPGPPNQAKVKAMQAVSALMGYLGQPAVEAVVGVPGFVCELAEAALPGRGLGSIGKKRRGSGGDDGLTSAAADACGAGAAPGGSITAKPSAGSREEMRHAALDALEKALEISISSDEVCAGKDVVH
ncbi:hypothetical protein GPECTOR_235g548 [Gonium pectorale]|uniref:Uncharacterized protein n=1 Tax=Gonium pectorale TaxID=33097 RepID=A0A150FWG0_GONPE|nr:hypothetical protein GPECTOR_235g548 [Gonium pectorale]|eukprot:KXZ41953.1 hypothetical protein GPECTOR_235g548 [Gonium pectorale]